MTTTRTPRVVWSVVLIAAMVAGADDARGQGLRWSRSFQGQGVPSDAIYALRVFDDGSGPALYAGGSFHWIVGGPTVNHTARWDGGTWSSLGVGTDDDVLALAAYRGASGPVLVAAGLFSQAGGIGASGIAQWDGFIWSNVGHPGGGINPPGGGLCLAVDGSILYVGGYFQWVDSVPARNVATWNGSSWSALGHGIGVGDPYASVRALVVFDDGTGPALYAGGYFTNASGVAVRNIAKWNGTAWSPLGVSPSDGVDGAVNCLAVFNDGGGAALYLGGAFQDAGGSPVRNTAKWDGATWSSLGSGVAPVVSALTEFDDGSGPALYFGGAAGAPFPTGPAKWDGSSWSILGSGVRGGNIAQVFSLMPFTNSTGQRDLYVGGRFDIAGAIQSNEFAAWRATPKDVSMFCFGDGTVAACPCGNQGADGNGCNNSLGNGGARLEATGSPNPDTIVLHAAHELPSALSVVLQGDQIVLSTAVFGDGLRCVAGHLKRLYTRNAINGRINAPSGADPSITSRSSVLGDPILPGTTRYYQVYYRDRDPSFCAQPTGGTFNVTNGVRIVW